MLVGIYLQFICLTIFFFTIQANSTKIPEEFFGKWHQFKQENYENYLAARGVDWFERKMMLIRGYSIALWKGESGTYLIDQETPTGETTWENVKLGQEFIAKMLDTEKTCKLNFTVKGNEIHERRVVKAHNGIWIWWKKFDIRLMKMVILKLMEFDGIVAAKYLKLDEKLDVKNTSFMYILFTSEYARKQKKTSNILPEEFIGTWKKYRDFQFDKYVSAHNPVIKAKLLTGMDQEDAKKEIITPGSKVIFTNGKEPGMYSIEHENPFVFDSTKWEEFRLGEKSFTTKFQQAMFNLNGKELTESRVHYHLGNLIDRTFKYSINADGELVVRMEYRGLIARKYYKKMVEESSKA